MVPSRNEFENYHSYINRSFQTHRFHFATDGKMKPLCRTLFIKFFTVRIKYIKKKWYTGVFILPFCSGL
ncbi:hypothetical protein FUT82_16905 [Treponema phagedenis]|uniref:Uncharacterized protein n=1 Tax=Treponema phagedenis TaxID=162 RepID=A0AAE6IWV4_TREPH|nr:hypothetical protein FUT82_16905 [Treponema phagedenis]